MERQTLDQAHQVRLQPVVAATISTGPAHQAHQPMLPVLAHPLPGGAQGDPVVLGQVRKGCAVLEEGPEGFGSRCLAQVRQ